jgi:hypothetical protein
MKHRLTRLRVALKLANISVDTFAYDHDRTGSSLLRLLKRKRFRRKRVVDLTVDQVDQFIRETFARHSEILDLERHP